MAKAFFVFFTVIFIFFAVLFYVQAQDIRIKELDPDSILKSDEIELTVNDEKTKFMTVKENDTLYVDKNFFSTYFPSYEEKIRNSLSYEGHIKFTSGEDLYFLPLLSTINAIGFRYTYSAIYGKEIVRIRTDSDFSVDPTYTYTPSSTSSTSHGNVPDDPVPDYNSTYLNVGYPVYGGPYWYGYYYPPGYQSGYYFGSYGFVPQGPSTPVITPVQPIDF